MPYLVAAVVLVGGLCLVDLIVSVGIIRRLQEQGEQLARGLQGRTYRSEMLRPGAPVGDFAATTTTDEPVSLGSLRDGTLVGLFSPGCEPCQQLLPAFAEYASAMPGGRQQVLAVVVGSVDEARTFVAQLETVALVVLDQHDGPVLKAFDAREFPALYILDADHRVRAGGLGLDSLSTPSLT